MDTSIDCSRPPSRQLLWLELRGIWELQAFFAAYPLLRLAPRGDGHPVLVLPGLAASDAWTRPLRTYLKEQGPRVLRLSHQEKKYSDGEGAKANRVQQPG
jgi:hypothetical protein